MRARDSKSPVDQHDWADGTVDNPDNGAGQPRPRDTNATTGPVSQDHGARARRWGRSAKTAGGERNRDRQHRGEGKRGQEEQTEWQHEHRAGPPRGRLQPAAFRGS